MKIFSILIAILLFFVFPIFAQTDSIKLLSEIVIKGYNNPQPWLRSINAISLLDSNQLAQHPKTSLLSALNTVAGVNMEERSPGSYRLSLRGSLLRSPFGIRNIKIYLNNLPLTDAGGNTYLNLIDANAIQDIEVFKGPDASIYGANTGGAILINTNLSPRNEINTYSALGSFGLLHQAININNSTKKHVYNLTSSYQKSDGYRAQSALERKYIQFKNEWNYGPKGKLSLFSFFSDLSYETPGGLTYAQLLSNPRDARLATATLPSAITQKAAIFNKTMFGGLTHSFQFAPKLKHVISLYGTHTDFKNPFITNFEERIEQTLGYRSFLAYTNALEKTIFQIQGGIEASRTNTQISNYTNLKGIRGDKTSADNLAASQKIGFLRIHADFNQKLMLELSAGINFFNYKYESSYPLMSPPKGKKLTANIMPKFAASYFITPQMVIRSAVSKGYSPPTLAEIRASDQLINTNLQAEHGWNYELGSRYQTINKRFYTDLSLYRFQLTDAIVRRVNAQDAEYFINAGGTRQFGIEWQNVYWLYQQQNKGIIHGIMLRNSINYANYTFNDFKNADQDFSGNTLTGTPQYKIVSSLNINLISHMSLLFSHNFTSKIALNDANTTFAKAYHLVDLKIQKTNITIGKIKIAASIMASNLFNENYSLGNDLNAVGNRYYNPAMKRNYQLTLQLKF